MILVTSPLMPESESELEAAPTRAPALRGAARHHRGRRAGAGSAAQAAVDDGRQRHLALVHRLEPARARVVRHRRVPLAGRHPGQGLSGHEVAKDRAREPVKHYYSSKPALLSTLIAGVLYPARRLTGIPLDRVVLQEREERWVQKPDESTPDKVKGVLEKPKDPVKWPAYVFYFKAASCC